MMRLFFMGATSRVYIFGLGGGKDGILYGACLTLLDVTFRPNLPQKQKMQMANGQEQKDTEVLRYLPTFSRRALMATTTVLNDMSPAPAAGTSRMPSP